MTRLAVTIVLSILLAGAAFAAVPQTISYQGYLADSGGAPVITTVTLTFSLYTSASGGIALWTETHDGVQPVNGVYSTQLGSVISFGSLAFDQQYYLGISVNGGAEMAPRQTLTSAPYALRAALADSSVETDPRVGTLASGKWCTSDGAVVNCTSNAPVLSEADPKIGANTTNYVSKWNGTALVTGSIYDNGNIGIGTASPTSKLEVVLGASDAVFSGYGTNNTGLRFTNTDSGSKTWGIWALGTSGYWGPSKGFAIGDVDSNPAKLVIDTAGNVGIGAASPGAKLDVAGVVRSSSQLVSTIATGTAPLSVASTTVVPNLNADMVDGKHATDFVLKIGDSVTGPLNISAGSGGPVISAVNTGAGQAGTFQINNGLSNSHALYVTTNGTGVGHGIFSYSTGLSRAGFFEINNASNGGEAVFARTNGSGPALHGTTTGTGNAGIFSINNPSNSSDALYVTTNGSGRAGYFEGAVQVTGPVSASSFIGDGANLTNTRGISRFTGRANGVTAGTAVRYASLSGLSPVTLTESDVTTLLSNSPCSAQNLTVKTTAAPGAGKYIIFRIRANGASTGVLCVIANTSTYCDSGGMSGTLFADSEIAMEVSVNDPSSTLPALSALFGWECR